MHRLTEFSLRRPGLTLAILLGITLALGAGVPRVKPAYGPRVLLGEAHPSVLALDSVIQEFAGGYPATITWECGPGHPCEHVLDNSSLEMADSLTRILAASDRVMNTTSPANAPILVPGSSGFEVRKFIEQGAIAPDASELAPYALRDPFWAAQLVSRDARVGAIIVQPADNRPETDILIVETIEKILAPFQEAGFRYRVVGEGPGSVSTGRALAESTNALIPALVAVIAALLFVMTRSWQHTLITLATMGIALLWTLGALGWLDWPRDAMLEVLAPVVVIVGVCDSIHILTRYAQTQLQEASRAAEPAILSAARDAGPACLITTLTSAGAFASFTASDLDTFVRFGTILPFGVVACLILSFSLLPVLITWLPSGSPETARGSDAWPPVIEAVVATSSQRVMTLLATSVLLLVFLGIGWVLHLRAETDLLEGFGSDNEFVQAVHFVENSLGSSQTLEIDVQLPADVQIEDPATLGTIVALTNNLSAIEGLEQPRSVLDLIRRLNRLVHGDSAEFERAGDSSAANAELLELISIEHPASLARWLSLDRSRLRISVGTRDLAQPEQEAILLAVEQQIRGRIPESWLARTTGEFALRHDWLRDVQATQLRSFPIAFGIVFVMVGVFLRSWQLALAAMVPTLLPVVVVLGTMGWLGMSLDVARAMLAAVVIGIGVDDAVHVLAHYKRKRDQGDDPSQAITAALHHTGRAVVTTSVALALGFLTLMLSAWQTVASFGFFVALAIMGALVATLFVLPALIFAFAREGRG